MKETDPRGNEIWFELVFTAPIDAVHHRLGQHYNHSPHKQHGAVNPQRHPWYGFTDLPNAILDIGRGNSQRERYSMDTVPEGYQRFTLPRDFRIGERTSRKSIFLAFTDAIYNTFVQPTVTNPSTSIPADIFKEQILYANYECLLIGKEKFMDVQ